MRKNNTWINSLVRKILLIFLIMSYGSLLFAQDYEWEIDKEKRREQEKIQELDSLRTHLKNNWQISLSFGQSYFNNSAKSKEVTQLEIPKSMNVWNLSFARYLSESLSVNVNLGILLKKIAPPRPDVYSIIGGEDLEIEGGGIFFMPVSIGVDYFFMKQRFRPYTGFSFGMVRANYKYIEAWGNISDGINVNENLLNDKRPFVELSAGFIYRSGKNVQLGLNGDYFKSKEFNENIGGYKSYNGFKISVVYAVVF